MPSDISPDQGIDGIIVIVPHGGTVQTLESLNLQVPVVVVGPGSPGRFSGAMVDQKLGARMAVGHLISEGHRRIGHISGPRDWMDAAGPRRRAGARQLAEMGLEADLELEGDWSAGSGYRLGRKIAANRTATAVLVGNDQMALGLLRALTEAGIRVPQDVSVVGFDDQPEAAYFTPPLTTVRQDFRELGRRCVDVMLAQIEHGAPSGNTVMAPELVIRASTASIP